MWTDLNFIPRSTIRTAFKRKIKFSSVKWDGSCVTDYRTGGRTDKHRKCQRGSRAARGRTDGGSGPAASTLKPPLLARPIAVLLPCTTTTSSGLLPRAELHCALHRLRHGSRPPGGHKCSEMTFILCIAANKNTTQ